MNPGRRQLLLGIAAGVGSAIIVHPARADIAITSNQTLAEAIRVHTRGAPVREGRVKIAIAELIDNGNAVPLTVQVESAMQPDNVVREIALFNEKNPQRDIARFYLSPHSGRAEVSTRIRLATTQKLVAIAQIFDGRAASYWSGAVEVIVTLAACIEEA